MSQKPAKNEFIRLMSYMKSRFWPYSIGMIGDSAIGGVFTALSALAFKDMVDAAVKSESWLLIRAIALMGIGLVLLSTLTVFLRYMHKSNVRKTMAYVRLRLFNHIEDLPVSYYEKTHSGDMISIFTNDLQAMEGAYSDNLHALVYNILNGLISALTMFLLEWRLASLMIFIGIITAIINTKLAKSIRKTSDQIQTHTGNLTERFTDILAGLHVIKMFNIGGIISRMYTDKSEQVKNVSMERAKKSGYLRGINNMMFNINFISVMSLGAFMVISGSIGFGAITAMTRLVSNVNATFLQVGYNITRLQTSLAGAARVFKILDETVEPERYDVEGTSNKDAVIDMKNVIFNYDGGKNALDGLNISVGRDQIAALVGPSGGGKSTVVKLLLGFYPPTGGGISIFGKPLKDYSLSQLRNLIAYVPQDACLYDGSIEENISYGKLDATRDEIIKAAKAANAHEFILEQHAGYDTIVGERGIKLSGGQKQRIAIARAILKDAPILLLDEATSSLDSENERLVQDALNRLMKGRTVIAIAHRLSTIEHADIIYVVDEGHITEQGNHSELVGKGGLYKRLYQLQFQHGAIEEAS